MNQPTGLRGILANFGSTQTVVCKRKQISARNYVEPCSFDAAVDAEVNRFCDAFFALGVKRIIRSVGGLQLCGNVNGRENSAGACTGRDLTRGEIEPRVAISPTRSVIRPCGVTIGQSCEGVSRRAGGVLLIGGQDAGRRRCNAQIEIAEIRGHHRTVGKAADEFNPRRYITDLVCRGGIGEVDVIVARVEIESDLSDTSAAGARSIDDFEQIS